MSNDITFRRLTPADAEEIVRWNGTADAAFLRQWSGRGYVFPLTAEQINAALSEGGEIFAAEKDGLFCATARIMSREGKTAHIGHFLVAPEERGKGLGTAVLSRFIRICFEGTDITALTLSVFDYNAAAIKCYEKNGFSVTGKIERPDGAVYEMRLEKGE